jgi:hypothetical protein
MVATFEGYVPAQTRPYGYGNNYLKIIKRVEHCCIRIRLGVESVRRKVVRAPVPTACAG